MPETALGSINITRKFGSGPVGFPDILSRYHRPVAQICCHLPHCPGAGRNGSRRKMAEADGSRKWQKQP